MTIPAPSTATARAAWLHAALAVAVVAVVTTVVPLGPWRPAVEMVVFGLGLAGVRVALRRHRTPLVTAWRGLGAALVLFLVSCAAEVPELAGSAPDVFGALEAGLDIAAYAALVVAAAGVLRGGRRRDWDAWTDTATLLLAAGLAVLAFTDPATSIAPGLVEVGIGTPLLTAVLLVVCVPLALSKSGRSVATTAMLAAAVLTLLGYGGRIVAGPLRDSALLDPLPLLAVAALILAGRHPSVATMGRRPATEGEAAIGRVLGLGAALLVSPALLVLWSIRHGVSGYVLGAGSSLLTGLALWRLARLNRERERTRAALAAGELRLRLLLENAADVIAIIGGDGRISYMSPAVEALLGGPPSDFVGRTAIELADPQDQARVRAAVAAAGEARNGHGPVDADVRLRHSSGGTRWVELRISGRVDTVGVEGWVVNIREVSDRKLFEDELRRQASTDALTGLLNRKAFSERLASAVEHLDPATPPAVLFVDVDDFKRVNDTLGHAAGDELLVAVAGRLTGGVRADDVVARLGGDEFALLLPTATAERLREAADRILTAVRAPVRLSGGSIAVTASVGGALGGPDSSAAALLHRADTAMYTAKRSGKDACTLLDVAPAVLT